MPLDWWTEEGMIQRQRERERKQKTKRKRDRNLEGDRVIDTEHPN
jgi:hypothetical protein